MALIRAQVILGHLSALPEDQLVNTLYFSTADTASGTLESIKASVKNIYNASTASRPFLCSFFSTEVTQDGHGLKLYNLDEPEPRAPISSDVWSLAVAPNGDPLPGEVACCMSFQAAPESGLIQARRRGRIFIGRLDKDSSTNGRPSDALRTAIVDAGTRLLGDSSAAANWTWVVYSKANPGTATRPAYPATFAPVSNGWVDNAFDTQRRRGVAPTLRTTFA